MDLYSFYPLTSPTFSLDFYFSNILLLSIEIICEGKSKYSALLNWSQIVIIEEKIRLLPKRQIAESSDAAKFQADLVSLRFTITLLQTNLT